MKGAADWETNMVVCRCVVVAEAAVLRVGLWVSLPLDGWLEDVSGPELL